MSLEGILCYVEFQGCDQGKMGFIEFLGFGFREGYVFFDFYLFDVSWLILFVYVGFCYGVQSFLQIQKQGRSLGLCQVGRRQVFGFQRCYGGFLVLFVIVFEISFNCLKGLDFCFFNVVWVFCRVCSGCQGVFQVFFFEVFVFEDLWKIYLSLILIESQ